ncbi:MAG: response regulator transcription factor [Geodermatophilaceae bacterium]|nr:response regulator transcription factor [Geodermatophilaceae bacterium]
MVLVDDHPVVRAGIIGMLAAEPDIDVVGEASTGNGALRVVAALDPDVVLMDLRMPDLDGVEATRLLRERDNPPRVVILTTYDTDADILRAVEAGATGYLLKDAPRQELAEAVRAAARGQTVLSPPVAAKLVSRMRGADTTALTSREIDVLGLVARGLTNAQIGRALLIAEATVKTHLLRAFAKLGVDDRTAAVTTAISMGIISSPRI